MAASPFPVRWLCGPAGARKSTVSWRLFTELAAGGTRVAFADTDQVCMCYPAPHGDLGRQRIKARNVGGLTSGYRAAGAQCLIANGVLDPEAGLRGELIPRAEVLVCRLRADGDEVERRFTAKHGPHDGLSAPLERVRADVRAMDRSTFAEAGASRTTPHFADTQPRRPEPI
jgi:hypothetical protein